MTIKFQALEWRDSNEYTSEQESSDSEGSGDSTIPKRYTIRIFGVTGEGESVCCTVLGVPVFFYLKVPDSFTRIQLSSVITFIEGKLQKAYPNTLLKNKCEVVKRKEFYGFTNGKLFTFFKLSFCNSDAMKRASNLFHDKKVSISGLPRNQLYKPYESNVDPMIRFVHLRKLQMADWIEVEKYEKGHDATTKIDICSRFESIKKAENCEGNAPILQASFDIEVFSQYVVRGKVSCEFDSIEVKGHHTDFKQQIVPGFSLHVNGEARKVVDVKNDKLLTIDKPFEEGYNRVSAVINKDGIISKESGINPKRIFPDPKVEGNYVTQIATAFKQHGKPDFHLKHIICLGKCDPINQSNVVLETYKTEAEVLLAWARLIGKRDPDIIYSYNGDGFDYNYLYTRAKKLRIERDFSMAVARHRLLPASLKSETFSSGAYGTRHYKRLVIPGRITFDVLIWVMREKKLDSYKLDDVAFKYLKQNKHDVTPAQMFEYFQSQDPEKVKVVAEYCIQDTLLPQRLVDKLDILVGQIAMSNVTYVPIRYLLERGQSIKVFSQIIKLTMEKGYLVPHFKQNWWSKYTTYQPGTIVVYKPDESEADGISGADDSTFKAIAISKGQVPLILDSESETYKLNKAYWQVVENEKFQGATVLDPKVGAYWEPVVVEDFSQLYPSVIRASQFCYTTIVLNPEYDNILGVEYLTVQWIDSKNGKEYKYRYAQNQDNILPELLTSLSDARKKEKRLMAIETDPFKKSIHNGNQLSYKISSNSCYGFLAAPVIKCKEIAASVTASGRQMIEATKRYCEGEFKDYCIKEGIAGKELEVTCVYGDSVVGDTPILLRNPKTGEVLIDEISKIFGDNPIPYEEFKPFDTNRKDKQQSLTRYEVWSDGGWTQIKRVIRHKTCKKIFRVTTNLGSVDVTEDHSLVTENLEKVKPTDVQVGLPLQHSFPSEFYESKQYLCFNLENRRTHNKINELSDIKEKCSSCKHLKSINEFYNAKQNKHRHFCTNVCKQCFSKSYYKKSARPSCQKNYKDREITDEEAFVWGMFFAEGSCGCYQTKWGNKYSWAINNADYNLLEGCRQILLNLDNQNEFKILETMKSSAVYKLVIKGDIHYYTDLYRQLFYTEDGLKKVPSQILNASRQIKQSFFDGYYEGDGSKTTRTETWAIKGKIGAQGLYYIAKSLGMDIRVSYFKNKPDVFSFGERKKKNDQKRLLRDPTIKDLTVLKNTNEQEYVYDLETDHGRFHAGVGSLCVWNTDSTFLTFKTNKTGREAMKESWELGTLAGKMATQKLFKPPHDLEFEKIFYPLLLFGKKRYIGNLHESTWEKPDYTDCKGVELKRRDNAGIVKRLYQKAVDIVLEKHEAGVKEAVEYIKQEVQKLLDGHVDISELVITKSLRDKYKVRKKAVKDIKTRDISTYMNNSDESDESESDEEVKVLPNLPHVRLAERMRQRDPASAPVSGDRIRFVFTEDAKNALKPTTPLYERCEDPQFVEENKLKIDRLYYLEQQLRKPLCQFFGLLVDNPDAIFDEALADYKRKRSGIRDIRSFFGNQKLKQI